MLKLVFDTAALITCCQFKVHGLPVVEHILPACAIVIPSAVQTEVTIASDRYVDAQLAAGLVAAGKVQVESVVLPRSNVLEYYKLGLGEKEAIALCLKMGENIPLITDDRLAYIVSDRMRVQKLLLLDLVVELVASRLLSSDLAEKIVKVTEPRYSAGFIAHTLKILERGDRRCLV